MKKKVALFAVLGAVAAVVVGLIVRKRMQRHHEA